MYIALFYWPNLSADEKDAIKDLSAKNVGNVAVIVTNDFVRVRYIDLADLQALPDFNVWELPAKPEETALSDHIVSNGSIISAALAVLKAGAKEAVWLDENVFNVMHGLQIELIEP